MSDGKSAADSSLFDGHIFLVGLSGSGKSTVGRMLSQRLGREFVDLDTRIELLEGKSVADIFEHEGEARFRQIEQQALLGACDGADAIVATGGGAVLDEASRARMSLAGTMIWLDAPVSTLAARLAGATDRPLLAGDLADQLGKLSKQRQSLYAEARIRIDASAHPSIVAWEIMRALCRLPAGTPNPTWVRAPSQTYPVYVGAGILPLLVDLLRLHGLEGGLRVIADERVAGLYGKAVREALGDRAATWYPVPAREEHKTVAQAVSLFDRLLADRPERSDIIVALGGGVIGDLAGYVAATLLRGMRFVQIPTTLLSQVDSSVGGKVGVDHPRGKNLVGAFHQPSLVVADLDVLKTLPEREIAAGWAEVVKIAVVQDAALFDDLEAHAADLCALEPIVTGRAIVRAIELKAALVERDEHDLTGVRAILNYGHTLGHAVEAATDYEAYLHGEGVAIGMRGAAHIAEAMGLRSPAETARQQRLLLDLGLPQHVEGADIGRIKVAMGLDKKRIGGKMLWILPMEIGAVRTSDQVPDEIVNQAIDLITRPIQP